MKHIFRWLLLINKLSNVRGSAAVVSSLNRDSHVREETLRRPTCALDLYLRLPR